jgi:hypothetical protein
LLQVSPNRVASSSGYDVKKTVLQASAFSLTQMAGRYASWTPTEIADRQRVLADLALETWPLRP